MRSARWMLVTSWFIGLWLALLSTVAGATVAPDQVALVDPSQGQWHVYNGSGSALGSFFYGNPGDFPILGDWDCDGDDTPGMYRQSDGFVYLRNSNSQGIADIRFFFGNPGDIPIVGDFNGDGCDTVGIYRPSAGRFFIINKLGQDGGGLGAAATDYLFGNPGDKPFVGDFNGDGIDTIGLHRESTGFVYFRNSHTQGIADSEFFFGDPGDRLVAGDWNNNGMDSPALFRPANTTMFFRFTNTQGNADEQFVIGSAAWLPVAGVMNDFVPPPPPPPPPVEFGAGTWQVGTDIPAGTYRNSGFTDGCYWERLSGFSGEIEDIITNNFTNVRQIVEIKPTDAGFSSTGSCGTWSTDLSSSKAPLAQFGGGTWQVPSEVAVGTWRNSPADPGCYWERLSGFSGEIDDIITNDFIIDMSQQIVSIQAGDVGFHATEECGTWVYLGP